MQTFSTPMMNQYMEIKKEFPDCLVFFRMGDFYELFMEDAHIGSRILQITLTGKAGGKDGRIPMAGVPYHAADSYITKLVKAGYKVAICEQLSPPNKKGLVKRGVVRIVTPGTLLSLQSLDTKMHNFIVCLNCSDTSYGLAIADLSTGYFALKEDLLTPDYTNLLNDLSEINPSECILFEDNYHDALLLKELTRQKHMNIFPQTTYPQTPQEAERLLKKHFRLASLKGFGISGLTTGLLSASALLSYLQETQNGAIPHITKIALYDDSADVKMDRSTMANLELFTTLREHDTSGSLIGQLDLTMTAMGGRLLRTWVTKPLADKDAIELRLTAVEAFMANTVLRDALRRELKTLPDIERLLSRLSVQLGNARDVMSLKQSLVTMLSIKELLSASTTPLLITHRESLKQKLATLAQEIDRMFCPEPPLSVREGGIIRPGVNEELDALNDSIQQSKLWIEELETREKERTGISSLKVTFNKVFGFAIEVSRTNTKPLPPEYIRKQTLVHAERYITDTLKHHEEIILNAEEKMHDIEYKIFIHFLDELLTYTECIQEAAQSIAAIDVVTTFSVIAEKNRYTKPKIVYSGEIRIKDGRHPVVEQMLDTIPFVPNDTILDNVSQSLLLITGPNMAGKSVYSRQVALIVLLAQIGSYVPASSAHISVVDRIFVRSGASDFITSGLSTFMVEMVETAAILHNATSHSLIIMDEIGRGTSTYDGISIAWSVAEYLVTNHTPPPKVLFATHYHELQELEKEYPRQIKNVHMAVAEEQGTPVFLHTLLPGGASHSFGISVAQLAGVPQTVLEQAKKMLAHLEGRKRIDEEPTEVTEYAEKQFAQHVLLKELASIDIASMTPLEALNMLANLKEKQHILTKTAALLEKD